MIKLISQQNLYDNDAPEVLSEIAALSADLPAIIEEVQLRFQCTDVGSERFFI